MNTDAPGASDLACESSIPIYKHDLFSPEALRAPFPHYKALRDLGPVARLSHPEVYVVTRYDQVKNALRASDALIAGKGIGFNDVINDTTVPNVLASDGDLHQRMKTEILRPLLPGQLRQHRSLLKQMIEERVSALIDTGTIDGMTQLARVLPLNAISVLVGLPEEGRSSMLDWAAAAFNSMGPEEPGIAEDFDLLASARAYMYRMNKDTVQQGSWAHALFAAMDEGRLAEWEARGALSAYVLPSLDTTIFSKGHLLDALAQFPEQWEKLRANPSLIPNAVVEAVRRSAVVRWFSRVAVKDYDVGGAVIPKGARVMIIYGAANRDERRFPDPDRFDVNRDARAQLAWGNGVHMCGGMHLARMEMEVMLEALVERCSRIESRGEPIAGTNRGLLGFDHLPISLHS